MSRSRNRADHEAMTLVRAGGPGSGGLSELIRAYGRRVLRDVKYCDEKLDFLLAILEPEERLLLTASIAELALAAGRPIDEDDLPSPHDASELSHEIRRLANRITRPDLERSVEKRLARLLSSPHDDGKGPAIPSMDLKDRLLSFAGTFNLSLEECSVLLFLYAANLCSEFEALFDNIAFQVKPRFIAICTGISEGAVLATLSSSSALFKSGLLSRDEDDNLTRIQISPMLVDGLSGFIGSFSHERFCNRAGESTFAPSDFGIEAMNLVIAKSLIESGTGFNLLLYGPPGTGKTEFAKSLVAASGKEAWFLGEGKTGSVRDRQAALALSAASIDQERQILIVDEADSLLSAGRGVFMAPHAMSKSWINGFLEASTTRVIWIVNWTRNIDESAMRRFSFALRFEAFSQLDRGRIWQRLSHERGIEIEPGIASRLAEEYEVNVAGISQALSLCATVRGSIAGISPESVLCASLDSQVSLVQGHAPHRERRSCEIYDPTVLNLDIPEERLSAAIAAWAKQPKQGSKRGLRFLFWGPPGTGKTELCRHLAAAQAVPIIMRRASDLLDKYVGGTEERIAAAFREAEHEGALLLIDEADSFLRDRALAGQSWEVTQVNEFLTQMESYAGLLSCCTNFMANLDAASLRRFQFKVQFRPLEGGALLRLIARYFPAIVLPMDAAALVEPLAGLATPGDLAAVAERLEFSGIESEWPRVMKELSAECSYKKRTPSIGFGRA